MNPVNRRDFIKLSGASLIGVTLGGVALRANAQDLVKLEETDPTAKGLQYKHKSEVEGSVCGNCSFIQGDEGAEWRPCGAIPGKLVNTNGWCLAYNKK